jgi:hypothetical protein
LKVYFVGRPVYAVSEVSSIIFSSSLLEEAAFSVHKLTSRVLTEMLNVEGLTRRLLKKFYNG